LPEFGQVAPAASKDIEFCFSNIGNTYGVSRTRQAAFTVTAVLPQCPVTPRRRRTWFLGVICNPEPAIGERLPLRRSYSRAIQNLREMVFARINAGIYTGARANAFDKRDRLVCAHRSPGIMTILFEIEYEEHARAGSPRGIGLCQGTGNDT